jgi:hypothetical protein
MLVAALIVGIVAAVMTVGAVVHAVLAWRDGHWASPDASTIRSSPSDW